MIPLQNSRPEAPWLKWDQQKIWEWDKGLKINNFRDMQMFQKFWPMLPEWTASILLSDISNIHSQSYTNMSTIEESNGNKVCLIETGLSVHWAHVHACIWLVLEIIQTAFDRVN